MLSSADTSGPSPLGSVQAKIVPEHADSHSSKTKKFFFSPRTNYQNAGDALINRELLRILRGYGEVHASRSGAPQCFLDEIRLDRREIRHETRLGLWAAAFVAGTKARIRREEPPFLILAPGDPSGPIDAGLLVRNAFFALLVLAGVRLARLGVSFSRMSAARLRLEALTSRFYFSGVRDSRSLAIAKQSGFANIFYFPDFAFALQPSEHLRRKHDGALQIGVSLREDNLGKDRRALTIKRLEQLLLALENEGNYVVIRFIAQVDGDRAFMKELCERFSCRYDCTFVAEQKLPRLADIYRSVDVVISNRLHGLLFASAQGAAPFGLLIPECNQKIIAILEDLGLNECWIDAEAPDSTPLDLSKLREKAGGVRAAFIKSAKLISYRVEALWAP